LLRRVPCFFEKRFKMTRRNNMLKGEVKALLVTFLNDSSGVRQAIDISQNLKM
jgi:hypothetical protein